MRKQDKIQWFFFKKLFPKLAREMTRLNKENRESKEIVYLKPDEKFRRASIKELRKEWPQAQSLSEYMLIDKIVMTVVDCCQAPLPDDSVVAIECDEKIAREEIRKLLFYNCDFDEKLIKLINKAINESDAYGIAQIHIATLMKAAETLRSRRKLEVI